MYLIDNSSPFDPGARPSNSSDASVLICERSASGVMTSSAGLSFSATLSSAKREKANEMKRRQQKRHAFITRRVVAVLVSSTELKDRRLAQAPLQQSYCDSFDGPAGAFFLSSPPFTPIFFKKGSTGWFRSKKF